MICGLQNSDLGIDNIYTEDVNVILKVGVLNISNRRINRGNITGLQEWNTRGKVVSLGTLETIASSIRKIRRSM